MLYAQALAKHRHKLIIDSNVDRRLAVKRRDKIIKEQKRSLKKMDKIVVSYLHVNFLTRIAFIERER